MAGDDDETMATIFPETNLYGMTLGERRSLVITKMIIGTCSVIGSSLLIYNAILKLRVGQAKTYHRLLIGMSIIDVLHSFFSGTLNTLLVPPESGAWAAFGTRQTCIAQGFFTQLSLGTPLYNASLSIFYMISIVFGRRFTANTIATRVEPVLHFIPWCGALVTAFIALQKDYYNALDVPEAGCWIEQYPLVCKFGEVDCTRGPDTGDELLFVKWALLFTPLWVVVLVVLVTNLFILYGVIQGERKSRRYDPSRASFRGVAGRRASDAGDRMNETIRTTACQGFWYVVVMLNTTLWFVLADISISFASVPLSAIYPLHILFVMTYPSQGFFNFIVYIRRRVIKVRHEQEGVTSYWQAFWKATFPDQQLLRFGTTQLSFRRNSTVKGGSGGIGGSQKDFSQRGNSAAKKLDRDNSSSLQFPKRNSRVQFLGSQEFRAMIQEDESSSHDPFPDSVLEDAKEEEDPGAGGDPRSNRRSTLEELSSDSEVFDV